LLGKLRIEHVLGEGGMGVVCKAHHLSLDQPVAIKFLLPALVENVAIVRRFLREAQSAVRLRGEHIARVLDVGTLESGSPYMLMEFLEGADLNQIIKHFGAQPPAICADIMLQACEGLAEAHAQGIIHRDIKPSNFFITRRPDGMPLLKILDFGISSAPAGFDSELTKTQAVIGTPAYMAPEQMRSARAADERSDLWSMGVVLYQMLARRRPFEAEAYSEMCLKVGMDPPTPLGLALPDGLEAVVLRCLEKNPDDRYRHVGELAFALAPYASDPALARGQAERATRTLGLAVPRASAGMPSAGGDRTPPPLTPLPLTPLPVPGMLPLPIAPGPGSASGSGAVEDVLATQAVTHAATQALTQAVTQAATRLMPPASKTGGGTTSPTTASASAGQIVPAVAVPPLRATSGVRRASLIGAVAVAVTVSGVGAWWFASRPRGEAHRTAPAAAPGATTEPTAIEAAPAAPAPAPIVTPLPPEPEPEPTPAPAPAPAAAPAAVPAPAPSPAGSAAAAADLPGAGSAAAKKKPVPIKKKPAAPASDDIFGSRQ
jgi:serine/threonine protein kinase